jgi:hypothetical protein
MAGSFDIFVTADKNLRYQQNLSRITVAIVVLNAVNTKLSTLKPLVKDVLTQMDGLEAGMILEVVASPPQDQV